MEQTLKQLGLIFLAVLSYCVTACSSDDDEKEVAIDTSPISLFVDGVKTINGADTIFSSNKFVAYGNRNTVHGWHVGETELFVNNKHKISISVLPRYTVYNDPICEWGCNMEYVKSRQKQGKLSSKNSNEVVAYDDAGGATLLAYTFKNGKLSNILALVSTNYTSVLADYLKERYLMLPFFQGEDASFIGVDGISVKEANTLVMLQYYNVNYWAILYSPASEYSTRSYWNNEKAILTLLKPFILGE